MRRASPSSTPAGPSDTETQKRSRDTSRIAWAKLLSRIAEKFPMVCPAGPVTVLSFLSFYGAAERASVRHRSTISKLH